MLVTADFPTWFRAGCYGGLGCSLISAAGVAAYALARRRGTPRQLAGAMLGCLAAAVCILPAILWGGTRLDLQGPALSVSEVLLWLAWVAVIGWMLPLGTSAGFLLFAAPFDARQVRQRLGQQALHSDAKQASTEERQREPLGPGIAWGRLVYLDGPYLDRQVALSRQIVLLGRERDNDILLDTDLASRYHAELHLEHGRAYLKDRGSMNGTSVNGQKIWGLAPLQGGDVLEIGGQRFRYEDLPPQASKSAARETPGSEDAGKQDAETIALPGLASQPAQSDVPAGWLTINSGPGAGSSIEMKKPILIIGRSSTCDVFIPDASISRQHAQLIRQEHGWYAQDLGSRNGTAVNGQRLSVPHRLEDGDTLTVGNIPLRYLATSAQSERETPAAPTTSEGTQAEEITGATTTAGLPPKPPTVPLREREHHGPLRLPSRPLEQPQRAPEAGPAPEAAAPSRLANNVFRRHRLIADRAFMAPAKLPPSNQS
jgi:pSer/pThr/pTyr-binding forkhead associated (FHA) protein